MLYEELWFEGVTVFSIDVGPMSDETLDLFSGGDHCHMLYEEV